MSPRARIALAIFVLIALALDFLFYTGFFASDDLQYLTGARKIAALLHLRVPGSGAPGMGNARLGMTVPAGFAYWISGGSIAAVAWFHVIYHLALVGLAFALGRLYQGERAGLVAAGIAVTSPIFYVFAGAILPDNPTAVWLAVILILLELVRRREAADPPLTARAALRWYFAIGALFGVAYSCKDTAIIMTVPAAACVMGSAPSLRNTVWIRNGAFMVAGLLAFLLVEALALRVVLGEWVFRPAMVEDIGDILLQRMEIQGGANPLTRFWFGVVDRMASLAPLTIFALLAGAVGYAFTRGRRLALLLFFWWPFVYMTVGTTSFTAYRPSSIQTRYYAIIIIPAAVMTAICLLRLWERWRDWSRPPAHLRGRLAALGLAVVAIAVVWFELAGNLPQSGNIYKAPFARGLTAAYQAARDDHPQYPILIGSTYGGRMRSLLERGAGERVHWVGSATAPPPEPPYLFVGLEGDGAPTDDPALVVEPLETVHPAASRFEVVKGGLRELFGLPPYRPPAPHPFVVGTVELVSRAGEPARAGRIVAGPWASTESSLRLRALGEGAMVGWDGKLDFILQFIERGGYQSRPRDLRAQLARPANRVRITVPLRLLVGKKARVGLYGFAYGASGELAARQTTDASLVAGASPTSLSVDLESAQPIEAVRIRLRVRGGRTGALFLAHPAIEER